MAFVHPEYGDTTPSTSNKNSIDLNLLVLSPPSLESAFLLPGNPSPGQASESSTSSPVEEPSNSNKSTDDSNEATTNSSKVTDNKPADNSSKATDIRKPEDRPVEDPIVVARKEQEARLYPELALTRQAMEALKEPLGTAKEKWEKANAFFHIAGVQVEKYIEFQGGINKIFHNVNQLAEELYKAIDEFSKSKRGISGEDYPGKAADEAILRQGLSGMSKQDQLAAIRGEKGAQLRESLFKMFNDDEKEIFTEIDVALNKVQLLSSIKLQHALAANKFGIENNDFSAKISAENILKSIAATDPETFKNNPEIRGLILQSERGEAMDLSEGKAFATAFTEEARKTIITTLTGVDALIDGEARRQGAERAVGLLVAALLANGRVTKSVWESWPDNKNFQAIFSSAESVIADKKT